MATPYPYPSPSKEILVRIWQGEDRATVQKEVRTRYQPGNEHLWDIYDIETLIDTPEKQATLENRLLYSRIKSYREKNPSTQ
jgi:plasmid rolling circle replication initiator protein Rep